MKKVAIITAVRSLNNYGQILQAYALNTYCKKMGFDCTILDFAYDIDWNTLSPNSIVNKLKLFVKCSPLYKIYQKVIDKCGFLEFKRKHLLFYKRRYATFASLVKNPPEVDVLLTGSDQIWGNHIQRIEAFMLGFGDEKIKRIAYAPSFGTPTLTEDRKIQMAPLISRYSAIGVREESGISIAASLGYMNAQWVPDPTLLLSKDEWINIASSKSPFISKDKKRVFVYIIGTDKDERIFRFVSQIGNAEIVVASDQRDYPSNKSHITIPQWIRCIEECDLVVTNSFHGTMFSLIFNKTFVTFERIGAASGMNVRVRSIMDVVGLNDHLVTAEMLPELSLIDCSIDWCRVNNTLKDWKKVGEKFLSVSLS